MQGLSTSRFMFGGIYRLLSETNQHLCEDNMLLNSFHHLWLDCIFVLFQSGCVHVCVCSCVCLCVCECVCHFFVFMLVCACVCTSVCV